MAQVHGGVSRKEYCEIVDDMIIENWDRWNDQERDNAIRTYQINCH